MANFVFLLVYIPVVYSQSLLFIEEAIDLRWYKLQASVSASSDVQCAVRCKEAGCWYTVRQEASQTCLIYQGYGQNTGQEPGHTSRGYHLVDVGWPSLFINNVALAFCVYKSH